MARILYGLAGEGGGHAARAKEIIRHCESRGHRVLACSSATGYERLRGAVDLFRISGLRLAYEHNSVQYVRTVLRNIRAVPGLARSLDHLTRVIRRFRPELVCTDFEPLTALVARAHGLPIISIDNQHQLTRTAIRPLLRDRRDALTASAATRLMLPRCDAYVVTDFTNARPTAPRTHIIPPILRREALRLRPTPGRHLLIYLTTAHTEILSILRTMRIPTIVYGLPITRARQDGHILEKPISGAGFLRDLASCRAVVANAGFSLVTEALHLGKPYCAIPVQHQFEQLWNATLIARKGYGMRCDTVTVRKLQTFLERLPQYTRALRAYPHHDNRTAFATIDALIAAHTHAV
ncbi:teichoic acid biosynthesis protein [Candidatus Uhrbacteria bacterium]|nr:teichoic acid biosynthesis protein [Candidatus Uhrbacteria bacterium]